MKNVDTDNFYRPDIDGLRAVSILIVLLFHAGLPFFPGGYVGVDVFFVISGFLITRILIREHEGGSYSIVDFYEQRIRRILPALLAVLLVTFAAGALLLEPEILYALGRDLIAASVFSSNIVFSRNIGYFQGDSRPLLHLWSLAVEEQFYIVFPVFLALAWRGKSPIRLTLAVAALSFVAAVWMTGQNPQMAFYLPMYRAWELLAGALLAMAGGLLFTSTLGEATALAGLTAILAAAAFFSKDTRFPGMAAGLPVAGAVLVMGSRSNLVSRMLGARLMVGIGLISYPLYLWHWPIFVLARYSLLRAPGPLEMAGLICLAFLLAWLTWRWIELPARTLITRRISEPAKVIAGAGVALAVIGGLGLVAYLTRGVPQRDPLAAEVVLAGAAREIEEKKLSGSGACLAPVDADFDQRALEACFGSAPDVLLFGDSLSAHLYPGLAEIASGLSIGQASKGLCPPIRSVLTGKSTHCHEFVAAALDLAKIRRPKTVVLSALWEVVPEADLARLAATIREARAWGATVIVVGQSPRFDISIPQAGFLLHASRDDRFLPRRTPDIRTAALLEKTAREAGAAYFDPVPRLCRRDPECKIIEKGKLLFLDSVHLTGAGSRLLANAMAAELSGAIGLSAEKVGGDESGAPPPDREASPLP